MIPAGEITFITNGDTLKEPLRKKWSYSGLHFPTFGLKVNQSVYIANRKY